MTYAAEGLAHEAVVSSVDANAMLRFLADESCDFAAVRALRFGQLVFAAGRKIELVRSHADRLTDSFVVLQPKRIRITVLP